MADNYLEKRQAQLSGGKVVYRKDNLSLETLLHRVAKGPFPYSGEGAKAAQLEAIARCARILFPDAVLQCDEACSCIIWERMDPEPLGAMVLVMKLKASELGFNTSLQDGRLEVRR